MKLTRALGLQHFLEALDIKIGWYLPVDRSRTNQLVLVSLSNPLTYTSLPLSLSVYPYPSVSTFISFYAPNPHDTDWHPWDWQTHQGVEDSNLNSSSSSSAALFACG